MSQGLFTAVSGIATNQAKIDVISDNIANMNTVAFKSNQVNFENVYVRTLSSGGAPGTNIGGTNPMQVGLGTTIGEITRNFASGTVQTTGRASDLNIQGTGFFTVFDSDGALILTRAGNFSLDSEGYLVNPKGLKAIGTDETLSTTGSNTPIKIPQSLNLVSTTATAVGTDLISNIDNATITEGTFTLTEDPGGAAEASDTFTIDSSSTLASVAADINASTLGITATVAAGQLTLTHATLTVGFGDTADTSSFLDATGLSTATDGDAGAGTSYESIGLNANSVVIRPADSSTATYPLTSFSIGQDGAIEATYANGDKITVTGEPDRELLYRTTTGRDITGAGITVVANSVSAIELQLQMANVINPKGLIAQSGNTFTIGPNAGYATFAVGKSGGMGSIVSGGLETSNVDLPSEFANMIIAQRGVDAGSRMFDIQNQVMRTLVNMGR
jgi:flagellar hook protein FlgE